MAIIGGFFKKQKHQRFEYKPRYWDPNKEDLENRIDVAKGVANSDPEAVKRRISNSLRRNYRSGAKSKRSSEKRSMIMLLGIIVALVFISYYLLTVYLPLIEESLGN